MEEMEGLDRRVKKGDRWNQGVEWAGGSMELEGGTNGDVGDEYKMGRMGEREMQMSE
jgi:hypothetical protein